MKRIILLIIFISPLFSSDVRSAYLYQEKNRCVDYFYYDTSGYLHYKLSHKDNEQTTYNKNEHFIPGYEYNETSGTCYIPQYIQNLALEPSQYYFLIGLVGVLVGFSFMFFMLYLFADVARK